MDIHEDRQAHIKDEIAYLSNLLKDLKRCADIHEKMDYLDKDERIITFLENKSAVCTFLGGLSEECAYALKAVIAIGQGDIVFRIGREEHHHCFEKLRLLLLNLIDLENFYAPSGGIIGYQLDILSLLQEEGTCSSHEVQYSEPPFVDLHEDSKEHREWILEGIKSLPHFMELYPVGGAGDRLSLVDEDTGEARPAACLKFLGRSLLEGVIVDLQAREHFYEKLFGEKITVPIAFMTSSEKDNHQCILEICEENAWFGRPKDSFYFFTQGPVPVVTVEGNWVMKASLELMTKPAGHGVVWALANEKGVFDWAKSQEKKKAIVRQINNPVADTDMGIAALAGYGWKEKKSFGFVSCPRRVGSPEGILVVAKEKVNEGHHLCLTNVEYPDFVKKGFDDVPKEPGSEFSRFPANTNLLFVDLETVQTLSEKIPLPGRLINMKAKYDYVDAKGHVSSVYGGRLESTMQNIADEIISFQDSAKQDVSLPDLPSYLTFNDRNKALAVTKKSFQGGKALNDTPEECFKVIQGNWIQVLERGDSNCPSLDEADFYPTKPLPTHFIFHPALGPSWDVMAQKIKGGKIEDNSELQLWIAELFLQGFHLDGSLRVLANAPVTTEKGQLGRCFFKDVTIQNRGINREKSSKYWRNDLSRHEELCIWIQGNGEFYAEGVHFQGEQVFHVADGERLRVFMENGDLKESRETIEEPTWTWAYDLQEDLSIRLRLQESSELSAV